MLGSEDLYQAMRESLQSQSGVMARNGVDDESLTPRENAEARGERKGKEDRLSEINGQMTVGDLRRLLKHQQSVAQDLIDSVDFDTEEVAEKIGETTGRIEVLSETIRSMEN